MTIDVNRREFLAASAAVLAAGRITLPEPQHHEAGHVMLFQGDSITDAGRNRDSADPSSLPQHVELGEPEILRHADQQAGAINPFGGCAALVLKAHTHEAAGVINDLLARWH